jgi:lysyl oxidase
VPQRPRRQPDSVASFLVPIGRNSHYAPRVARVRCIGALACAVFVSLGIGAVGAGAAVVHESHGAAAELLPDLDPAALSTPRVIAAEDGSGKRLLTFSSLTVNRGAGPLVIHGHRASIAEPKLVADQLLQMGDGTTTTVPAVSALAYDGDLRRWGLEEYITYELRRPTGKLVATGPPIGFCVVDWVDPAPATTLSGEPADRVYTDCGKSKALELGMGLSVGWGNLHRSKVKGQLIDITHQSAGKYVLVDRVNPLRLLTESNLANDASSLLIQLSRPVGGALPTVKVLKICANKPTCSLHKPR